MKTSLKINIHSVVDVITNSSTTIYTQAREGSIDTLKEIINSLLDLAGSDLKADDLFTFEITSDGLEDIRRDLLGDNGLVVNDLNMELNWGDPDYKKYQDIVYNKIVNGEIVQPEWWDYGYDRYHRSFDTSILVTAKDKDNELAKKASDLLSSLDNLFDSEEGEG